MGMLAPLALGLGAVILPAIIIMYMLKLRREERLVSSTLLWRMLARDVQANTPWQRLRRNLLLFLQLLAALLLLFALARPFLPTPGISTGNLILMIDRSASMGASDAAPSRLEAAKAQAIELVDQLPDGGRATVIAFGGELEIPAAASSDRRELRRAIESIQLQYGGGSDMAQAISLGSALAARSEDSEIAILSDGGVTVPMSATLPGEIRFFPIGTGSNNQGLAALTLESISPEQQTIFARVHNEHAEAVTRRLVLEVSFGDRENFELFNAYDLTVLPGQDQSINVEVSGEVRLVRARLDGADDLPGDDTAWAVQGSREQIPVRLVTPGNRFLAVGLSIMPRIEVTAYLTETETFTDTPTFTILDRMLPEDLPAGNLLIIAPPRSTEYFSVTGTINRPTPRPIALDDQLLRHVSMGEINIREAVRIEGAPWAHTVVESDGGPLMLSGEVDGRRIVLLTFALHDSDLPINAAFPLLLSNWVGYLAPGAGGEAAQFTPGTPLALPLGGTADAARVIRPDGESEQLEVVEGVALLERTNLPGLYDIQLLQDGELVRTLTFAANPYSAQEADIAPIKEIPIAQVGGGIVGEEIDAEGRDEWWRPIALIALVILVIEWLVAHKAGLRALSRRMRGAQT